MIKTADYLLDLGPDGGVRGGEVVAQGTPEEVAAVGASYTRQYLKPMLARAKEAAESTASLRGAAGGSAAVQSTPGNPVTAGLDCFATLAMTARGGVRGDEVVAAGIPESVAAVTGKCTGAYLKPMLGKE